MTLLRIRNKGGRRTIKVVFDTTDLAFYWCVVPDGMDEEEAWSTQERHGPFKTEAELAEALSTEGGIWGSSRSTGNGGWTRTAWR